MRSSVILKAIGLCLISIAHLLSNAQQIDTVYSRQVNSYIFVDGQAVPEAEINYTLIDTLSGATKLIRNALTDSLGLDMVDSLPVLKHEVGINDAVNIFSNRITISNNGTGSDHLIRFTSEAEEVSTEAYIVNLLGQKITSIPVQYNSATKTYDAVWKGQAVEEGIYLFHAPTSNGPVASKIKHVENRPSVIDYGAEVEEKEEEIGDGTKSGDAITDLAKTKYAINISKVGLEDFVDTVWVHEDTPHDFFFNVTGIQYDDADVWGQIFFVQGGNSPTNADVEYKRLLNQSEVFNTTAPNGVYNIQVPVVYEPANPGETKYIVTITENGDPFITQIDTVLVTSGTVGVTHYVTQQASNDNQDIEGIVRNVYTKQAEAGVTVRVRDRTTGDVIDEVVTGSNGEYLFEDFNPGDEIEFELGKPGELWMVNNEYDVPAEIIDTLITFNRYFYPKNVQVPQVGTNTTIVGEGEEAAEMVGTDKINFEEILRDQDLMWANGPTSGYWSARSWIADNFYEGNSPIATANTQRNITATMQQNYEPYTNFYPGQLGWNVNFGSGNSTSSLYAATNYNVTAVIGGEIMTSGQLQSYIKELQGRRLNLGTVNSRVSFMNASASMPNEKDRAYVYMILINQDGRFDTDQETYSLENLTSIEPTSKAANGKWADEPGNKPHCRTHINHEKL